jgi:hypothetical protein
MPAVAKMLRPCPEPTSTISGWTLLDLWKQSKSTKIHGFRPFGYIYPKYNLLKLYKKFIQNIQIIKHNCKCQGSKSLLKRGVYCTGMMRSECVSGIKFYPLVA